MTWLYNFNIRWLFDSSMQYIYEQKIFLLFAQIPRNGHLCLSVANIFCDVFGSVLIKPIPTTPSTPVLPTMCINVVSSRVEVTPSSKHYGCKYKPVRKYKNILLSEMHVIRTQPQIQRYLYSSRQKQTIQCFYSRIHTCDFTVCYCLHICVNVEGFHFSNPSTVHSTADFSNAYPGWQTQNHHRLALLALCAGKYWQLVDSPHKVTRNAKSATKIGRHHESSMW